MAGCSSTAASPGRRVPVRFEFAQGSDTNSARFLAATSDPAVIAQAREELAKPPGSRGLHIHGLIAAGDGGYNKPWHWHFVEDQWHLAPVSIEVCDATPDYVEANLQEWLSRVKQYCPWASIVHRELEPRS